MSARAEGSTAEPRFPLFDSLRAIAALSVFAVHLPFAYQMASNNPIKPYLLALNFGVPVFFLISGFLLYRPFARARFEGVSRPATAPYARRRVLRIVPAYWVALPLVVLLLGPSGEAPTATAVFSPQGVVSYFGFLQTYDSETLLGGISAAWTLCVEVAFYALLPLWALLLRRVPARSSAGFLRSELLGLTGLFAIGVAWTTVAAANARVTSAVFVDVTQIEPWLYLLPGFLDHFALGMALAVLSVWAAERSSAPRAVRVIDRAPWIPWLVAGLAYLVMANLSRWLPGDFATQFVATHEMQALFAFALLMPAVFGDPSRGLVRRLLANRVMLWIGLVSYALYLWHVAIIVKLIELGVLDALGRPAFIAAALGVSLIVAAASFYAVERPALRLGRRLSRRRRSHDADARARDLGRQERPEPGVP